MAAWISPNVGSDDVVADDPMDAGVEQGEAVKRVNQRLVLEHLDAIPEADDTDLADAADTRAGGLHVDGNKVWCSCIQRRRSGLLNSREGHYARSARLRNVIDHLGRSSSTMLCSHSCRADPLMW